jgi:UDP-N-acetylmuramoylalanine--D-glutamate ligase
VHRVIRSPGFARRHGALAPLIEAGIPVTTPGGLWFQTIGAHRRTIAITGTKGKSTTTSLAERALRSLGERPIVAGNIGVPIWDIAAEPDADEPVVMEVSSYMAADLGAVPSVGVLTSLGEDHVSWHGSLAQYRADKLAVFTGRSTSSGLGCPVVVPCEEHQAVEDLARLGVAVHVVRASDDRFAPARAVAEEEGVPEHVLRNLACAVVASELLMGRPLGSAAIADVLRGYEPLPSRHRTVATRRGIRWVDDALASNPLAAATAVEAVPEREMVLILGGTARGVDSTPLREAIERRAPSRIGLVALPDNGAELIREMGVDAGLSDRWQRASICSLPSTEVEVIAAPDVGEAVRRVADRFDRGVCLFAPAAPTPPRFGTYVERAAAFGEAVDSLD